MTLALMRKSGNGTATRAPVGANNFVPFFNQKIHHKNVSEAMQGEPRASNMSANKLNFQNAFSK